MVSAEYVRNIAQEAGFNCCGIARCRHMPEQKVFFDNWLSKGFHSGLNYLTRYQDIRFDPAGLLEGAKTVIICAVNYKNNTIFNCSENPNPKIATYALAKDYHITIKQMLGQMVESLRQDYPSIHARTFTDTAPLLEKSWAVEAGLGWIGKNSLLITPQFGSLVLLGEIVIDIEADLYDTPYLENHCGECDLCLNSCPNGAIVSPRVIDTGRCISRLTIESLTIERHEAALYPLHGWVFGCDVCQSVCPHNRRGAVATNPDFQPMLNPGLLTREFWLNLDGKEFKTIFGQSPLLRAGLASIQQFCYLCSIK